MSQPNILFLMTDEQRFDHLGCVNPAVHTPHLDRLAAAGVRFTRAYTSNPSCVQARAGIFTGKYPHQCHAPSFITYLPEHEKTFMSRLQAAGYHTAAIGKQHFGGSRITHGYDYEDIVDTHTPEPQNPQKDSYCRWLRDSGFDRTEDLVERHGAGRHLALWKADPKFHVDHYVGDRGREWFEKRMPENKPWFCWISFPGPHGPIDCGNFPEAERYDLDDIDMPVTDFGMLKQKPHHNSLRHGDPPPPQEPESREDIRKIRRAYYANVTLIDREIGAILEVLKARSVFDDTLIVLTSDHGDFLGDFQLIGKGQNIFEVLMRIPLIVKPAAGVGQYSRKMESSLISSIDIAPTCLAAAGLEIPAEMAGRDLSRYWQNPDDLDDREDLYMEAAGIRCLRTRRWKYAHYWKQPFGELYDLENDPWEKRNLWDCKEFEDLKANLQRRLLDKLIELSPKACVPWNHGAPELGA